MRKRSFMMPWLGLIKRKKKLVSGISNNLQHKKATYVTLSSKELNRAAFSFEHHQVH